MKKIETILIIVFVLLISAIAVFAQETPEDVAKKYDIVFPITELGNCTNLSSCREFCEDPVNQNICIEFAKKKGFYREDKVKTDIRNNDFWEKTRLELGCDSESSCRAVCEQPQNFDKCNAFAKKQGLSGGHTEDPANAQILEKAKTVLGCTSYESCTSYCSQDANREKCSQFAQQVGLRGGERNVGPGGCTSEETCGQFCSDPNNYQICSQYTNSSDGQFSGPGGCSSEASCRDYCEKNPSECGYGGKPDYDPSEMCNKTSGCAWANNTCTCSSIGGINPEEYCQRNPDKCGGYQNASSECTKHPGCSWTGNTCQCSGEGSSYDPSGECSKYPGCSWNGSSCQCSSQESSGGESYQQYSSGSDPGSSQQANPPPTSSVGTGEQPFSQYDQAAECTKTAGCSWNGSFCQCSSTSGSSESPPPSAQTGGGGSYDPASECTKYPNCSWTGNTCQCGGVQGAKTTEKLNFFQLIWNFLFGPRR